MHSLLNPALGVGMPLPYMDLLCILQKYYWLLLLKHENVNYGKAVSIQWFIHPSVPALFKRQLFLVYEILQRLVVGHVVTLTIIASAVTL